MAQIKVNGAVDAGNGLGPTTVIVSIVESNADLTEANVAAIINFLTNESDTQTAFTVAGVSGDVSGGTQTVHLALQGTGTVDAANADLGLANTTVAVVCTFTDA